MELSFEKKNEIGFQYVLDLLEPCSCYGAAKIRALSPYTSSQKEVLEKEFNNIEKAVFAIDTFSSHVTKLNHCFMHLKDVRPIVEKCRVTSLNEVELFEMKRFLLTFKEIFPLFSELNYKIGFEDIYMTELVDALKIVDPDNTGVPSFYISDTCSNDLRDVRKEKKKIELLIRSGEGNKDQLMIERTKIAAKEEAVELEVKKQMSKKLMPYLDDMVNNIEAIGRVDLFFSKASLTKKYNSCKPVISQGIISMKNMINPQVANVLSEQGKSFTPITIELESGSTVITGANMGGKSVALKTTALNTLLALCGIYPFATEAYISMLDDIFMISEDLESIDRGLSSFGGEIIEFNNIAGKMNEKSFLLLDEFARGTNPDEGAAIVRATTKWLNSKGAISVISTHFDKVAECANNHYQVIGLKNIDLDSLKQELSSVDKSKGADRIAEHMDYGLYKVSGKEDCPRDALNICRLLDMNSEIISLAENCY